MLGFNKALSSAGGFSDRLNNTWTTLILVLLGVLTFWMQIYMVPISCWTPAEFTPSYNDFTLKHCWYANRIVPGTALSEKRYKKYPVVFSAPRDGLEDFKTIYQWIPLILMFQALAFMMPYVIWNCGLSTFGLHPSTLFGKMEEKANFSSSDRIQIGRQMARYLCNFAQSTTMNGCPWGPITILYIIMKIMYVVNSITQFSFYNSYLLENRWLDLTTDLNLTRFNYTPVFPKTVICDYNVSRYHNVQQYTVQCEMHINQWYHWICGGVRIWFFIIMIITVASLVIDVIKIILPIFKQRFLMNYLCMMEKEMNQPLDARVNSFYNATGQDIILILKIVAESTSEILVGMTVIGMWDIHTGHAQSVQSAFAPPPETMPVSGPRVDFIPNERRYVPQNNDQAMVSYAGPRGENVHCERGYVPENVALSREDAVPFLRHGHMKNSDT